MKLDTISKYVNMFEVNPCKVFKDVRDNGNSLEMLLNHYEDDSLL